MIMFRWPLFCLVGGPKRCSDTGNLDVVKRIYKMILLIEKMEYNKTFSKTVSLSTNFLLQYIVTMVPLY